MSKSVSHYLKDYLNLKGSAKFNIYGGAKLPAGTDLKVVFDKYFVPSTPTPGDIFTEYTWRAGANEAEFREIQADLVAQLLALVPAVLAGGSRKSRQSGGAFDAVTKANPASVKAPLVAAAIVAAKQPGATPPKVPTPSGAAAPGTPGRSGVLSGMAVSADALAVSAAGAAASAAGTPGRSARLAAEAAAAADAAARALADALKAPSGTGDAAALTAAKKSADATRDAAATPGAGAGSTIVASEASRLVADLASALGVGAPGAAPAGSAPIVAALIANEDFTEALFTTSAETLSDQIEAYINGLSITQERKYTEFLKVARYVGDTDTTSANAALQRNKLQRYLGDLGSP